MPAAGEPPPTPPRRSRPAPEDLTSVPRRVFNSQATTHIAHLKRLLSTTHGIDSTLELVTFSLILVNTQLEKLLNSTVRRLAESVARTAGKSLGPGETMITTLPMSRATSRLADVHAGTKELVTLIEDCRAFMRCWGLLSIWVWARDTFAGGPKDKILKIIAWAQIVVNGAFHIFENAAFLASKGVLRGWTEEKRTKWFMWSVRCFAGHILLDFVRLWRLRQLGPGHSQLESEKKVEKKDTDPGKENEEWWRETKVDFLYAPLALHWSIADEYLGETGVAALGVLAGWIGFKAAWRESA